MSVARLGIIGAGHLAGFVVAGLRRAEWGGDVVIPERGRRAAAFAERHGAALATDNQAVADRSDAVLVAVHPADVEAALSGLRWPAGRLLLSAMAGVKIARLAALAPGAEIVRCMPISAAAIGASPTPLFPADAQAETLLAHLGAVIPMASESALEAASVNAAAYGWYFRLIGRIEAANITAGLDAEAARRMAIETLAAAAAVARVSDAPADTILRDLATPGGITAQGLDILKEANAFEAWDAAFAAVATRVGKD